jgi:hypothetical protein
VDFASTDYESHILPIAGATLHAAMNKGGEEQVELVSSFQALEEA